MTNDDRLFGYRLQLFDYAARTSVAEACRVFGVHRSTYYVWRRRIERHGLEILRPRERRTPRMPNQLSRLVEERIVAFSLGHPGLGPRRVAAQLARPEWGGLVVSHNAVYKVLRRHGLATRRARLALVAGYRAPYEPPSEPDPEPHIDVERPGELVGVDCFKVGRLHGTQGEVWQLTAIDVRSSFAWAELVACKRGMPSAAQTSHLIWPSFCQACSTKGPHLRAFLLVGVAVAGSVCATRGQPDMRGLGTAGPGFVSRARRLATGVTGPDLAGCP